MKRILSSLLVLIIVFCVLFATSNNVPLQYKLKMHKDVGEKPPVLFLLHGYGSNKNQFNDVIDIIDDRFLVVSIEAPYGFMLGFLNRWYEFNIIDGDTASNQTQIEHSKQRILSTIDTINKQYNYNISNVFIGGFSQGGIMAFNLGLSHPEYFAGIFAHSARIPIKYTLRNSEDDYKDLNVLILHGTEDSFSKKWSIQAKVFFDRLGANAEYFEDSIGHEMSKKTITKIYSWLNSSL
tara:strand:- start:2174 stop:2884 length:711 start_codon:yes stop_codon:yes gene_type:complete